jgi:hypothetical protein
MGAAQNVKVFDSSIFPAQGTDGECCLFENMGYFHGKGRVTQNKRARAVEKPTRERSFLEQ